MQIVSALRRYIMTSDSAKWSLLSRIIHARAIHQLHTEYKEIACTLCKYSNRGVPGQQSYDFRVHVCLPWCPSGVCTLGPSHLTSNRSSMPGGTRKEGATSRPEQCRKKVITCSCSLFENSCSQIATDNATPTRRQRAQAETPQVQCPRAPYHAPWCSHGITTRTSLLLTQTWTGHGPSEAN